MRHVLLVILLVATVTFAGQTKPERRDIPEQNKADLAELQKQVDAAKTAVDVATARYEAVQQRLVAGVYKTMADLKISPSEWDIKLDQKGEIFFERKTVAAAAPSPKPTVAKPQ